MAVGKDDSGKYYVCQGQDRYAGPYDDPERCRRESIRRGLGGGNVRLAGRTVVGGDEHEVAMLPGERVLSVVTSGRTVPVDPGRVVVERGRVRIKAEPGFEVGTLTIGRVDVDAFVSAWGADDEPGVRHMGEVLHVKASAEMIEPISARLVDGAIHVEATRSQVLAVLDQNARPAIEAIEAADYSDEARALLVAAERERDRPRVTVLRALGVDV